MRRRDFLALTAGAAAWPLAARAQQAKVRTVAVLMPISEDDVTAPPMMSALEQAFTATGWQPGTDLRLEYRWGKGAPELFQKYAAEFVAMAPDVILVTNTPALAEVSQRTQTIPIVFVTVVDPVGQGFVTDLAHPGGNITGFLNFEPPMMGKWLAILKEMAPAIVRVGVMYQPQTAPYYALLLSAAEKLAPSLGLEVVPLELASEEDIRRSIAGLAEGDPSGLFVVPDSFTSARRQTVTAAAAEYRVPAMYGVERFMESGGLVFYGIDQDDLYRRAAGYVDRILRGANPGDLPVRGPSLFELEINLRTANDLGLSVPPALVATANRVIE